MSDDDPAPVDIGADAASQLHIVEKDYGHAVQHFSIEKHFLTLSMITRGVTDGTSKVALAISAALVLSPSSHLNDNKGKLVFEDQLYCFNCFYVCRFNLSLNVDAIAANQPEQAYSRVEAP
jgi:hypothetical protein